MKIKNTTYTEKYNGQEDKLKGIITIHLEHETLFGIGVTFEFLNNREIANVESKFIPKNINDIGKDKF